MLYIHRFGTEPEDPIEQHDKPREQCGIAGIFGHPNAAELTYLALYALQHRGQESAGIVATDGSGLYDVRGMGLVADVFNDHSKFATLRGNRAIGHVRYSTAGGSNAANIQPLVVQTKNGPLAIAHNGNLVNALVVRRELEDDGAIFQTESDTELFVHLIARSREATLTGRVAEAVRRVTGAFSIVLLSRDEMVVARDPHGFRPLCLGRKGDAVIAVSETCALDLLDADYERDIRPGEIVTYSARGTETMQYSDTKLHMCVFELIYFARPDSRVFGDSVDRRRRKLGKILAEEAPCDADIVISVPDSSNTSAIGYSRRSGIKFEIGLIRNHYIGRTFINPSPFMRSFNARIKYNPVVGVLKDRRVVLVEDSIVRGTTLKKLVGVIRRAGAKEVHVRVASPPVKWPCFYGMDFPTRKELIAAWAKPEQIKEYIGADSLRYLSEAGMLHSTHDDPDRYCAACFTGKYPVPLTEAQYATLGTEADKDWARMQLDRVLRSVE
ncbi:amidophosphoribosyltransferase [candidate division KSB1 bacterium]|nr:amidophosphoribosyltransferase [candidate division KSB1 bacterium]